MSKAAKLTRNEKLVLDALRGDHAPMTAYQLLDRLRPEGLKAPLQIYRALRALGDRHLVHKLDSQNAFMACTHHGHGSHDHAVVFLVCTECQKVIEVADEAIDTASSRIARTHAFVAAGVSVEIRGRCADCAAKAS